MSTGTTSLTQLPSMLVTEAILVAIVRELGLNQVEAILEGVLRKIGLARAPRA